MEEKSTPKTEVKASEVKPKKGNKMLFIIIAVIIAACVICSGIGFVATVVLDEASNELEDELDDISEDSINDSIEDAIEDGIEDSNSDSDTDYDFSLDGEADLPDGFPSEVKMYDGAKISSSMREKNSDGNYEYTVIATADDSAEKVIEFFKDSLEDEGWEVTSEANIFGYTVSMESDDFELVVVALGDFTGGDGSTYTLSLTEK